LAAADELGIETTMHGSVAVVKLDGAVNVNTFEKLDTTLFDLFREQHYSIVCDMAKVKYMSSAGAGVFMHALSECRDSHGNMVLINLSAGVMEVFDLLNLTGFLPTAPNLEAALAAFR